MKARHIFLLTAMIIELILFFYCFIRKSNHVPAGYICGVLSLILFVCTGWLLLFPKVTPVETTGKYKIIREDSFILTHRGLKHIMTREAIVNYLCLFGILTDMMRYSAVP